MLQRPIGRRPTCPCHVFWPSGSSLSGKRKLAFFLLSKQPTHQELGKWTVSLGGADARMLHRITRDWGSYLPPHHSLLLSLNLTCFVPP